jgi:hypothetical protein
MQFWRHLYFNLLLRALNEGSNFNSYLLKNQAHAFGFGGRPRFFCALLVDGRGFAWGADDVAKVGADDVVFTAGITAGTDSPPVAFCGRLLIAAAPGFGALALDATVLESALLVGNGTEREMPEADASCSTDAASSELSSASSSYESSS